jgi:hypothetical protein
MPVLTLRFVSANGAESPSGQRLSESEVPPGYVKGANDRACLTRSDAIGKPTALTRMNIPDSPHDTLYLFRSLVHRTALKSADQLKRVGYSLFERRDVDELHRAQQFHGIRGDGAGNGKQNRKRDTFYLAHSTDDEERYPRLVRCTSRNSYSRGAGRKA